MDLPKGKSPRIPGFDYSSANYYFITICTHEKRCIFGKPGQLNWIGTCAEDNLKMISVLNQNIRLDKYVVMPNHIHAILDIQGGKENSGEDAEIFSMAEVISRSYNSESEQLRENMAVL